LHSQIIVYICYIVSVISTAFWQRSGMYCVTLCVFAQSHTAPTGCNANVFYADEPKTQVEVLRDAFWDYVATATQTADDTLQTIRKSQLGQDIK